MRVCNGFVMYEYCWQATCKVVSDIAALAAPDISNTPEPQLRATTDEKHVRTNAGSQSSTTRIAKVLRSLPLADDKWLQHQLRRGSTLSTPVAEVSLKDKEGTIKKQKDTDIVLMCLGCSSSMLKRLLTMAIECCLRSIDVFLSTLRAHVPALLGALNVFVCRALELLADVTLAMGKANIPHATLRQLLPRVILIASTSSLDGTVKQAAFCTLDRIAIYLRYRTRAHLLRYVYL